MGSNICTYEKGKSESSKKSSHKSKKGKTRPGTNSTARVPKKVRFEKQCNLCKKHGTNNIEKLEKALKKSGKKGQKHRCEDSNFDSE